MDHPFAVAFLLAATTACGGRVEDRASPADGGAHTSDAATPGPAANNFTCGRKGPALPPKVLFETAGSERIVASLPYWALIEPARLVAIDARNPIREYLPPSEYASMRPVAITYSHGEVEFAVYVLLCSDSACRVFGARYGVFDSTLVPIGSELSRTTTAIASVDGVVWIAGFGGIYGWSGTTWTKSGPEGTFLAMAVDTQSTPAALVVVGQMGAAFVRTGSVWQPIAVPTMELLRAVRAQSSRIAVATNSGRVYVGDLASRVATEVEASFPVARFDVDPPTAPRPWGRIAGITSSGRGFDLGADGRECILEEPSPLVARAEFPCPLPTTDQVWLATQTQVLAALDCPRD